MRGLRGRGAKESEEDYLKVVVATVGNEVPSLFARAVVMTEATSVGFQTLKRSWIESGPMAWAAAEVKPADIMATQLATQLADKLADRLLDAWAKALTGLEGTDEQNAG